MIYQKEKFQHKFDRNKFKCDSKSKKNLEKTEVASLYITKEID